MSAPKPHKFIHPLADRVLIRRDEAESISKGGILIAATAQEKPRRGTVLAVGPGRVLDDGSYIGVNVGVGAVVIFDYMGGTEIEHMGEKLLVVAERFLICAVTDPNT